jgi:hypothetical protein
MAFTFNNYATNDLQQNPLNDIIKNMFSGYSNMTNAQFLRPNLQEQLKKSQLYNQYYGPNMESQIGLRGAQAGHLGALTQGQNITNTFLPRTLQEALNLSASQRGLYGAQTSRTNALAEGQNIANHWMPRHLQQQLIKEQLENEYYGPGMESQIGLRGAQAGHYGALTQGQNITNQYLPKTLQEDIALKAAQRGLYGAQSEHYGTISKGQNITNTFLPRTLQEALDLSEAQRGLQGAQSEHYGTISKGQNITNQYLPKTLQEEIALKAAQRGLYGAQSKYYGPDIESQIGLRGAQAGNYGALTRGQNIANVLLPDTRQSEIAEREARTGLLGQQIYNTQVEGKYLPQSLQAKIAVNNANAQQAKLIEILRERMLGSQKNDTQQPQLYQGNGMFNNEQLNAPQQISNLGHPTNEPKQIPTNNQGMNYPTAAIASQLLKLGQPKIVDVDGKQVAISPLGNFDTGVQGLTAQQKAQQAGMGKYAAKLYGDANDSYRVLQSQGLAINDLVDAAENNPQFRNVTGRINKPLTNWFGSPEQKELLGRLQSSSGEISLQVAPSLKGSFTGFHQSIINEIKASPNDFPDVFIGKLKAQKLINDDLTERARLLSEYLEQGYKPTQALQRATKETPLEKFIPQIKQLISHKNILTGADLEFAKQEAKRRGLQ